MPIKVKNLIKKLKKMPQDLEVYWADHDHGEFEINSSVGSVGIVDKSTAKDYHARELRDFADTPDLYVVIRP